MVAVLVQIDAWDPVAGAPVAVRAASHDDPSVCHALGTTWWPVLTKLPVLRYDLFDTTFEAKITAPTSGFTMSIEPWAAFARYAVADARVRIWTGEAGSADYTLRFDGRASGQPKIADLTAQVEIAVDDRWLDAPLLATYAGTGGAEGDVDLAGQAKPLALGAPRYVAGTLVDKINSVFQVSAYGAINGFEAALERLARYLPPVADHASYDALVAAAIPPGAWATAKAVGMARFGAPPQGQISFLLRGDAAGPNGWARKPGQIIRRLALLSGGAGRIDDASLDALDAARPWNLSPVASEQTTARELIQAIAASVNAVAGVSWLGKLFVRPVAIGAPSVVLDAAGGQLPPVASIEQIEAGPPWWRLAIQAVRCWTVHGYADIATAAALTPRGAYNAATVYREGDIVSQPDGGRWEYISLTPSSGHAPPDAGYWAPLDPLSQLALAKIDEIGSDNIITRVEKPTLILQWVQATASYSALSNNPAGAPPATIQAATDAKAALDQYLGGLQPAWNDVSQDTPVDGPTLRNRFAALYSALSDIEQYVGAGAGAAANGLNGNGTVKPNKVNTASIVPGSIRLRAAATVANDTTGDNTLKTVASVTINLPVDTEVVVLYSGYHAYSGGIPDVEIHPVIDGTSYNGAASGAGAYLSSFAFFWAGLLPAGQHTIAMLWRGGTSQIKLVSGSSGLAVVGLQA